jgi:myo-inositol-1(or 4)-monophosphatase
VEQIEHLCREGLAIAQRTLKSLRYGGAVEVTDHVTDISTKGDRAISRALTDFFSECGLPAVLYTEESGRLALALNPRYTIAVDDLDGTDNYFRGMNCLPFCTVITFFSSPEPAFQDAVLAGVLEHNSGQLWLAFRGSGCYLDGRRVTTSRRAVLDRRTLVTIDHYASGRDIPRLLQIYPRAWVKDFGSSAFHLAGTSSGLFDAYLDTAQKAHELGAGYLLVTEAGGFIGDFQGVPLARAQYDFGATYSVVAAASRELGEALISILPT